MNNTARVIKIHSIEKHPNADRLQVVSLFGTQVITDMSAKQGDLMIYFDSNLQLSEEYCYENNLYRHCEKNKDNTKTGYIGDNRRVLAIRLRNEFSDGMLMPLDSIKYATNLIFGEGDEFANIDTHLICQKYIVPMNTPGTPGSGERKNHGKKAKISPMFVEHWDTGHYMKSSHEIPANSLIYIEEKIHGTSNRTGNVEIFTKFNKFQIFLNRLILRDPCSDGRAEFKVVNGTRRTIISDYNSGTGYHDASIRDQLMQQVEPYLYKGEEIYCEIAGYEKSGRWIQKDFPYGAEQGKCRYFLYRVSHNNEDGVVVDLSRLAVYSRAKELGLETAPLLATYYYSGSDYSKKKMDKMVIDLAQGQSALDPNTLREGVVVWFMNKYGKWTCLKYKQDAFRLKESNLKEEGIGDIEDTL